MNGPGSARLPIPGSGAHLPTIVQMTGIEPARDLSHEGLNLARLPDYATSACEG